MNDSAIADQQSVVQRKKPPLLVTAIAVFELAAAALIFAITLCKVRNVDPEVLPRSLTQIATLNAVFFYVPRSEAAKSPYYALYISADPQERRLEAYEEALLALPIAGLIGYIGFGLMRLNRKARALAIVSSTFTVIFWLRGFLFAGVFGDLQAKYFTSPQTKGNIVISLVLNGFIALSLLYGSGVAEAFGEKE